MDEICTTSINISLNTDSDPACGEVSHDVTISDNVVYPDGDSKYFIDRLQSNTLHNITVTSRYNYNGSRIFYQFVRTSSPKCKYQIHNLQNTRIVKIVIYVHTIQLYIICIIFITNIIMSL